MNCLDAEAEFTHEQFLSRRGNPDDYVFSYREPLCVKCVEERFRKALETGIMEWTYEQ